MSLPTRKRILISIDWFAPGYKAGGPIRSCINFAYAMRDTYDMYILTGDRDFGEKIAYPNIETNTWIAFDEHIQVFYASPDKMKIGLWKEELKAIDPDFVYLNNFFSLPFSLFPLWAKSSSSKKCKWIIAPRGMLHQGALQFKSFKKKIYILILKILGLLRGVYFQATDAQEKEDIQRHLSPTKPISIISNLPYSKQKEWTSRNKEKGSLKALFFSRISPKKNLGFFLNLLEKCELDIKLDIIGPIEDASYWEQCKEVADRVGGKLQMEYLGVFPHEKVMERLAQYHVFILPTHGENFGHAIFEALLAGCPVLISDQTPWRKLAEKKVGWDIPLSDEKAYIAAIEKITEMDQSAWDTWSKASWAFGKNYLEQSHSREQYQTLFS